MAQVERGEVPEMDYGGRRDRVRHPARAGHPQSPTTTPARRCSTGPAPDPAGYEVMKRVAADENRHHLFYRGLGTAALEGRSVGHGAGHRTPGPHLRDARHRHRRLRTAHARAIAVAGIYDLTIHHDAVLMPVLIRHWDLEHLRGSDADAARERTAGWAHRAGRKGPAESHAGSCGDLHRPSQDHMAQRASTPAKEKVTLTHDAAQLARDLVAASLPPSMAPSRLSEPPPPRRSPGPDGTRSSTHRAVRHGMVGALVELWAGRGSTQNPSVGVDALMSPSSRPAPTSRRCSRRVDATIFSAWLATPPGDHR